MKKAFFLTRRLRAAVTLSLGRAGDPSKGEGTA